MTIAIAAYGPRDQIVTVSDARLSYGDSIPASDEATMKNRRIASKWGMLFAAEDSTAFMPVITDVQSALGYTGAKDSALNVEAETVKLAVQAAYEKEFNERFFRENLARFGFKDITEFRQVGFSEMGKDLYNQYADKLARFDLGLELLVYGFSSNGTRQILEVSNPGAVTNHRLRGYGVIGSGTIMALAALNRKPIEPRLGETIYRLLDAKFSSETARDVGKKTHVITLNSSGRAGMMSPDEINQVRAIWEETVRQPEPSSAVDVINQSKAVTVISDEQQ